MTLKVPSLNGTIFIHGMFFAHDKESKLKGKKGIGPTTQEHYPNDKKTILREKNGNVMEVKITKTKKIFLFIYIAVSLVIATIPFLLDVNYYDTSFGKNYALLNYLFFPIILIAFSFSSVRQPVWRIPALLLLYCIIGFLMSCLFLFYDISFSWSGKGNDWIFGILFYGLYALLQYHVMRLGISLPTGTKNGFLFPVLSGIISFLIMKLLEPNLAGTGLDNGSFLSQRKWVFFNIYPLPAWQIIVGL